MNKFLVAGAWLLIAACQYALGQSVVFVSPSTQGLLSMSCAAGTLSSLEEMHYLAAARYLAGQLCSQSKVDGGVGFWRGQAENTGMIDGCPNDPAREIGALLGKYYHQKAALVFDRNAAGKSAMLSFHTTQQMGIISIMMTQSNVTGATVIPGADNWVVMVATDTAQHDRAMNLYSLLHARDLHEEAGNAELIGDSNDRTKAREVYAGILAQAPPLVKQLSEEIYSERFHDLGLENMPAQ